MPNFFTKILYLYNHILVWLYYNLKFSIKPSNNCYFDAATLIATNHDPQTRIKHNRPVNPIGFYMLEISVTDTIHSKAQLYFDYGMGFNENNSLIIHLRKGCNKRVCHFKKPVKKFRFDPADSSCKVENPTITLKKLTGNFALRLMQKKFTDLHAENSPKRCYKDYDTRLYKPVNEYINWINRQEPKMWDVDSHITKLFSIITPTYNSKPAWIKACAESIMAQSYRHFEWIMVDDASTDQSTLNCLIDIAAMDKRFKLIKRKSNGHISVATNSGIAAAKGEFVLFLDHDDLLAPQALNELAQVIAAKPDTKIIYSDEDFLSEEGERISPHFKPDWNLDLLLSHNYITHLCCYSSTLLQELGGMRQGVEGAQDYDLILRASTCIQTEQIVHIPKILYHWRMVESSTSLSAEAKPYTVVAGTKALENYLSGTGAKVFATSQMNFFRIKWPVIKKPLVSIIIPTRDGLDLLKPCIDSLLLTLDYNPIEIIILDNNSIKAETLAYFDLLKIKPYIHIIKANFPFNFSKLINLGAAQARGDILLLLNNDIEAFESGWFEEMLSHVLRDHVGCVGAKLYYPDKTIQHAGVILGLGGYAAHSHRGSDQYSHGYFNRLQVCQNLSAVTAACLMVRKSVFKQIGGLDEEFTVAYNDVDFCLRVKQQGFDNVFTPFARLIHHESKTRGADDDPVKRARFNREKDRLFKKWQSIIEHDPAYNPNLTRNREDFSIR